MSPQETHEKDKIPTSAGDLVITFLGHGSLMFDFNRVNISVDPFSRVADYTQLPKADLILITHEHHDHLDKSALDMVRTENSDLVLTETCAQEVAGGIVMHNGDMIEVRGIPENTPEMKALTGINVAFLPMNLPYTMTPEMVADAARAFKPTILYPYHFGSTNTNELVELLKNEKDIEVRIRKMA
jgi:L-ascorbate metabolism protein UlaG (beta-lactamase superfamily)